ncbi:7216_t:CDS:2 [Cetraspora pellucida]|uniref:7216_t:CDS:1 n=1 Tax=Cetraspora pellucida TaxID=1433469 RepID=A0A9N9BGL7_9GLOM|nr:7216_t:CDS:2 [Cetraspora pellucida]
MDNNLPEIVVGECNIGTKCFFNKVYEGDNDMAAVLAIGLDTTNDIGNVGVNVAVNVVMNCVVNPNLDICVKETEHVNVITIEKDQLFDDFDHTKKRI